MKTAMEERWCLLVLLIVSGSQTVVGDSQEEVDGPQNRRLLGSSVVTSVSVIMDHGNGTKTFITDGKPPPSTKPEVVGTPGTLMSPDRYEFYSFGKDGELVKKLMTLEQIQGLIAGGDELSSGEEGLPVYYHQPLVEAGEPEGVSKVLESVQNVLKTELQSAQIPERVPVPDSWSILLPGFLNSELDFKQHTKPITAKPHSTASTAATTSPPPPSVAPILDSTPQGTRHPSTPQPTRPAIETHSNYPKPSTIKYSAHYTTPPPNMIKTQKPTKKPYLSTTSKRPTEQTSKRPTESTTKRPSEPVVKRPTEPTTKRPTEPTTKRPVEPTTIKMTTKFVEKTKPSGIPTIIHYLPIQSGSPSDAPPRTTAFPAISKPTPKPIQKPSRPAPAKPTSKPLVTETLPQPQKIVEVKRKVPQTTMASATNMTQKLVTTTPLPRITVGSTASSVNRTKPVQTTSSALKGKPNKTTAQPNVTPTLLTKVPVRTTPPATTLAKIVMSTAPTTVSQPVTTKTQATTTPTQPSPTKILPTTTSQPTTIYTTTSEKSSTLIESASTMEEIPLKLLTDLKDPQKTILGLSTIPALSTIFQTVTATTEPVTMDDKTTESATVYTTTDNPTTLSKLVMNRTETNWVNVTTISRNDSKNSVTEKILGQSQDRMNSKTTVEMTTWQSTTDSSTQATESTTVYKDQVMEEGIPAVTNILLNENDKRFEGIQEKSGDGGGIESETVSTTENTTVDSTESAGTSTSSSTLPDLTTSPTTVKQEAETTVKPQIPAVKTEPKKDKPIGAVPTKESKLNPDSDEMHEIITTNNSNTVKVSSGKPEVPPKTQMVMEQVKLTDSDKTVVGLSHPPVPSTSVPTAGIKRPQISGIAPQPPPAIDLHPAPYESMGLEASIAFLGEDVRRFADLCNELAFRLWTALTGKGQISSRSLVLSPFAATSLLAMVFLGARGSTSGQMNEILRLDDMVTFNPHQVLQNVSESVVNSKNNGVATAAFVRQLYSDKSKGKILDFYKERVQQYYQGHVEEINFSMIGDIIRRRTNLLVKRQTLGKVPEYLRGSSLNMKPPLAAFSANIFQTDCESGSTEGRDGEMYFVVRPSTRQRRLVPVPAVLWRGGFLAGYEPSLDATSVCLGSDSLVSTLLVLPGQQGQVAPGDGLSRLEQRLIETSYRRGGWSRLLRSLLPRPGLELQVPRFSHRSVLNVTGALARMGLKDLFSSNADLRGLNGISNDLHLSDMVQVNTFSTCGEETIGARHHVETYPASPQRMGRDDEVLKDRTDLGILPPRGRQNRPQDTRLPDAPRLRFDRPFLYVVRHNPSGMILHMGRFNPRLLP